jgi:hypothetical protein
VALFALGALDRAPADVPIVAGEVVLSELEGDMASCLGAGISMRVPAERLSLLELRERRLTYCIEALI